MGGNAFKGSFSTVSILRDEVTPTLNLFFEQILKPAGVESYSIIGSAGLKPVSGDIDIAVCPFDVSTFAMRHASKETLLKRFLSVFNESGAIVVLGSNIAVSFPIAGRTADRVQIDVILSSNAQSTAWLMAGTQDGVKGAYRNLMLSYVAKIQSKMTGSKISIAYPGGIEMSLNSQVILQRTEDPHVILRTLGIHCEPSDVTTFEGLVTLLTKNENVSSELLGYPAYIQSLVDEPRTSLEAKKSIEVLYHILKEKKQ